LINTEHVDTKEQSCLEADFIAGCGGANSIVDCSLFGDWDFLGKTWAEQLVATNVRFLC
jgi:hypothetical protein